MPGAQLPRLHVLQLARPPLLPTHKTTGRLFVFHRSLLELGLHQLMVSFHIPSPLHEFFKCLFSYVWLKAQHHAFQPPNSTTPQAAGSNGHGQPNSGAPAFHAAPGSVASLSQSVPSLPPGMPVPAVAHGESANGFSRAEMNNFAQVAASAAAAVSSGYNNTHNNFGAAPGMPHPPPAPALHAGSEALGPSMHPNSFNGNLPFGSRSGSGSQNSGFHPYRRS